MKPSVFVDLERLRHPHTGLYNFCENLGDQICSDTSLAPTVFIPRSHVNHYAGLGAKYITRSSLHKLVSPASRAYDVVHITHQFSKYLPPKHPNVILTIHDLNFLYTGKANERQSTLAAIQRKVDRASTVVAISDFVLGDLKQHLNLEGKHLARVHNGVTLHSFPDFDSPRYRPTKPFLFSLGVVRPKKNTHTLPCLLADNDYELIIAGDPDEAYASKIKQEARQHGVESRVTVLEPVTEQEKYWYLNHCLAYMQPSLSEGFGLPVIEAMRFGKPLFLSNQTSLPEIGGPDAFYFENFDPDYMRTVLEQGLNQYHKDPERAQKLIDWSQQFTWEKAGAEYLKLYHNSLID